MWTLTWSLAEKGVIVFPEAFANDLSLRLLLLRDPTHLLWRGVTANVRLIDDWRAQLTIHHLKRLLDTRYSLNRFIWLSISRRRLGRSLRLRVPNLSRVRFTKWGRIILNIEMSRFYQVLKGRGIEAALEDLRIICIKDA